MHWLHRFASSAFFGGLFWLPRLGEIYSLLNVTINYQCLKGLNVSIVRRYAGFQIG